jgi:hypothetical protein
VGPLRRSEQEFSTHQNISDASRAVSVDFASRKSGITVRKFFSDKGLQRGGENHASGEFACPNSSLGRMFNFAAPTLPGWRPNAGWQLELNQIVLPAIGNLQVCRSNRVRRMPALTQGVENIRLSLLLPSGPLRFLG